MADMAGRRTARRVLPLLVALLAFAGAPTRAATPPAGWATWAIGPGVEHLLTERPGLVAHAARISAGAPVALRPVVAFDRVGGGHAPDDGRQPVSELCRRAGGIVCVNADFFNCGRCGQPAGGLVDRARPLRSFRPDHEQVSVLGGAPTFDPLGWVGTVRGVAGRDAFRLPLASLNRGPTPGGAVVYTPDWGPTTPEVAGQVEVVLATGGPYVAGVMHAAPVARRATSGAIPRDGVVIAANGRAAEKLNWIFDAWRATRGPRELVLDTALSAPADLSVGGHPILLRDGVAQPLDPRDPMTAQRHPRTLLAWTPTGELLLVAIDGRQPGYSDGATLTEAVALLRELGASDAINLDGGGSTTFALRCDIGACVANRPSGGRQRPVPLALAVVPVAGGATKLQAAAAGSNATPTPVTPEPAPVVTTAPPRPSTTTTVTSIVSVVAAEPAVPVVVASAASAHAALPPPSDRRRAAGSRAPAAVVAAAAITGWGVEMGRRRRAVSRRSRTAA
jgi:hypothetical protein